MKTVVALRHVHFEDLGSLEPLLRARGFKVHYYDAGVHESWTLNALEPDLLVVLGGPIGAFDEESYPFLNEELELIEQRLTAQRPLLGICLGAQLMARALGLPFTQKFSPNPMSNRAGTDLCKGIAVLNSLAT